jgi:hypothetical protein
LGKRLGWLNYGTSSQIISKRGSQIWYSTSPDFDFGFDFAFAFAFDFVVTTRDNTHSGARRG